MAFCRECGTEIGEAKFCPECGRSQVEGEVVAEAVIEVKDPGMHTARVVLLLGALGLVIGAFLPWITATAAFIGTMNVSGIDGDGKLTAGIGALLVISGLISKGKPGKMYSAASGVFAVIAGLLLISTWSNVSSSVAGLADNEFGMASVGSGLYLSALAAILAAIGGFMKVPE